MTPKDPRVRQTLERLAMRFGPTAFVELPHWDADLLGTGIARPDRPEHLVYFRVGPAEGGDYFVSLEGAPPAGSTLPYRPMGDPTGVDFEWLAALVGQHLELGQREAPAAAI